MKTERLLQLIGVALFLIITLQTYAIVTPVNDTTNTSQDNLTSITSTTATTTGDNNIIANIYRAITAIATGGVIAPLAVFFLRPTLIENAKKKNYSRSHR